MAIELLDAKARVNERRGPKILIHGLPNVGKTSLLNTLPLEMYPTVLMAELEGGDLPVAHLPIDSLRPQTWSDCRDLVCALSGPDPARAPGAPYSQSHFDAVTATGGVLADLEKYSLVFVDSFTEVGRKCRLWAEQQSESFNAYGKRDTRGMYGLVGRELIGWAQRLQSVRWRTIVLTAVLEKHTDDFGVSSWRIQLEGRAAAAQLPAILDEIIAMTWVTFTNKGVRAASGADKAHRAFVCQPNNALGFPAKDRSGRLSEVEEPHLGKLLAKLATRQQP
jgi:GTPase SAR1 family protein